MDLDIRKYYSTKFRDTAKSGLTPDNYIEYYKYIKDRYGVDIDFFKNAPEHLVFQPGVNEEVVKQKKEILKSVKNAKYHLEIAEGNLIRAINDKNKKEIKKIRLVIKELKTTLSKLQKTLDTFSEQKKRWGEYKFPLPDLETSTVDDILRDNIPDNFCLFPFTQINIDPDGRGRPCCKWAITTTRNTENYSTASLVDENIQELFDQPYIEEVKKEFLRGEKPKACKACWDEESAGLESIRVMEQEGGKRHPIATWFHHIPSAAPRGLDLKLSSICNNKCRICSPFLSSKWLQEHEDLGGIPKDVLKGYRLNAKEKFMTNPENVKILKHWAPNIRKIQFFGGEPLLQTEHNLILKTLVEEGTAKNTILYYNTNGSIYDDEICKYWESFNHVNLNYSIDDIGKRFDYERHPAKYVEVMDNVRKYNEYVFTDDRLRDKLITSKKYFNRFYYTRAGSILSAEGMKQRGMKIAMINRFYITIGVFNIYYLDEILNEFTTRYNFPLQFNPVHFPHHYATHILPTKLKDIIKKKLTEPTFVENMNNKYIMCDASRTEKVNDEINNLITFMYSSPENPGLIKEALRTIKIHDDYRNESFGEVFPEIYEFLKEYE